MTDGPAPTPAPGPTPASPTNLGPTACAPNEGLGQALYVGGALLLPVGLGAAIGYWAADREVRWAPTMVGALCVLWFVGLAVMIGGLYLLGPAAGLRRGRRRIVGLTVLAILAAVGRFAADRIGAPSPLTTLDARAYEQVFRGDVEQARELDRGLASVVHLLSTQPGLFDRARPLTADEEAVLLPAWASWIDGAMRLDAIRLQHEDYLHFDLSRVERPRHLKSFLLTFRAELALYGRTADVIDLLQRNPDVVTYLNQPRPDLGIAGNSVASLREELTGVTDLSRIAAGERYLQWLVVAHGCDVEARELGLDELWRDVEVALARVKVRGAAELTRMTLASDLAPFGRKVKGATFPIQANVAEWMGDARVRRPVGKYLIGEELLATMRTHLAPGDVLLGRKNWYVSNLGLPGFWPHALLYVGTQDELAKAFDDDPDVRAWVQRESGKAQPFTTWLAERYPAAWAEHVASAGTDHPLVIIEAVSEGVVQSTMAHAAGDYCAALRPRLSAPSKARAVLRAFGWLGRPYDFDFDFATDTTLVCTEVVWRSYAPTADLPGLALEPLPVAGRRAIPANQFARWYAEGRAKPDAPFEFVWFIDAEERTTRAFVADEAAFASTAERPQWDWAQR